MNKKTDTDSNAKAVVVPREFSFVGSAQKDLKAFPKPIMEEFNVALTAVQYDKPPTMPVKHLHLSKGKSAIELIRNGRPAYRVVYSTKKPGQVYVLYAGKKTTQGTDRSLIEVVEERLKAI